MVHLTSLMHIFDRVWTLVSRFVFLQREGKIGEGGVKEEVGRVAGCKERGKEREKKSR